MKAIRISMYVCACIGVCVYLFSYLFISVTYLIFDAIAMMTWSLRFKRRIRESENLLWLVLLHKLVNQLSTTFVNACVNDF